MSDVYESGQALANKLFGNGLGDFDDLKLMDADDPVGKDVVGWLFGYLMQDKSAFDLRAKMLCVVAMLTATNQTEQLARWIPAAQRAGCERREVQEAIMTMAMYSGWPAARRGFTALEANWPQE